jgi:hypothetical protein
LVWTEFGSLETGVKLWCQIFSTRKQSDSKDGSYSCNGACNAVKPGIFVWEIFLTCCSEPLLYQNHVYLPAILIFILGYVEESRKNMS